MSILGPRTHEQEVHGLRGGQFSPDRTKFFAYTYVPADTVEYDDYQFILMGFRFHSSMGTDSLRQKKAIDGDRYGMKDMDECIKEGIYRAWSIKFTGILYEGQWFVQKGLTFWGEQMTEQEAIRWLTRGLDDPAYWSKGSFGPPMVLNGPDGLPIRDIEDEEFAPAPWLVVNILRDEKEKVNSAFEQYMNVAFVDPFLQRMRIDLPDEYVSFSPIFGHYTLLYPRERTHFLLVTVSKHRDKGYRLVWFYYAPSTSTFYRWTWPQPRYSDSRYFNGDEVIGVLSELSQLDLPFFVQSPRTIDDPHFWAEYVLKREGGRYVWLEQTGYPGIS